MQDQHFMQSWNHGHKRFSRDLERTFGELFAHRSRRRPPHDAARSKLSNGAQASLRGLAASLLTAVLWAAVIALATPAPGLATIRLAQTGPSDCTATALA